MPIHIQRIEQIDSPDEPNAVRVVADVHADHLTPSRYQLWIEVGRDYADALSLSGNPWLLALAVPAALDNQPLCVDAPVDPNLYQHVHQLMRIWHTWGWTRQPLVPVDADVQDRFQKPPGSGLTGLFFSGGVDSLFSLLSDNATYYPERRFQIDDLINVWGLNERAASRDVFEHGIAERQQVSEATGKPLLVVRTNLREMMWRPKLWEWVHPMLVAAAGLALERRFRRLLMASDVDYARPLPRFMNPLEVPLFSTRGLDFQHDGGTYERLEKLMIIARNPLVQQTLNVCGERRGAKVNCGRCAKCLRTMAALDLAGLLPKYSGFDTSGYPGTLASAAGSLGDYYNLRQLLPIAQVQQRHELIPLIGRVLRRYEEQSLTRRARIEQFLSDWVLPARVARWIGRTIDRTYATVAKG